VRVNKVSDWLPAREAARIDLSLAVSGEKLAADRNCLVFGMIHSNTVKLFNDNERFINPFRFNMTMSLPGRYYSL
jgi:hypothetical protein